MLNQVTEEQKLQEVKIVGTHNLSWYPTNSEQSKHYYNITLSGYSYSGCGYISFKDNAGKFHILISGSYHLEKL